MITSFRVIKLEPGDYTTNTCTDFSFLNDNLECIWAIDSLNRKYKLKKKEFNKLIIEAKNTRITEKITPSVLS